MSAPRATLADRIQATVREARLLAQELQLATAPLDPDRGVAVGEEVRREWILGEVIPRLSRLYGLECIPDAESGVGGFRPSFVVRALSPLFARVASGESSDEDLFAAVGLAEELREVLDRLPT